MEFREVLPSMPVLQLESSIAFYSKVGFQLVNRFGDDMAIVQRGKHEVCLWTCLDPSVPLNHHFFVVVHDVHEVRLEFEKAGIATLRGPRKAADGVLMLEVPDPSGHALRFISRTKRM